MRKGFDKVAARVATVALGISLLCSQSESRAATLMYDISAAKSGNSFSGYAGNWGFAITTTTPQAVSGIGLWDEGSNGLVGDHSVGIFDAQGALLVSAVVTNASTVYASAAAEGRWLFTSLASAYTLPAGTYTLGFYNQAGATDPFRGNAAAVFDSSVTYVGGKARANATSFAVPDANSAANQNWFGPNLLLGPVSAVVAPTPTALMGSVALFAVLLSNRRR